LFDLDDFLIGSSFCPIVSIFLYLSIVAFGITKRIKDEIQEMVCSTAKDLVSSSNDDAHKEDGDESSTFKDLKATFLIQAELGHVIWDNSNTSHSNSSISMEREGNKHENDGSFLLSQGNKEESLRETTSVIPSNLKRKSYVQLIWNQFKGLTIVMALLSLTGFIGGIILVFDRISEIS